MKKNKNKKYICELCDFNTSNKRNFNLHLLTLKHFNNKNAINLANLPTNKFILEYEESENIAKFNKLWICNVCGKKYQYDTGLYKHKKKCNSTISHNNNIISSHKEKEQQNNINDDTLHESNELIKLLHEKEKEIIYLKGKMNGYKEGIESAIENNSSNIVNSNNTVNNIFNLNLFLNEKCANAMSIQDFTENLKINMSDLQKEKPECITNVMISNLDPLSITERPFHCSNIVNNKWVIKDQIEGWQEDNGERIVQATEYGIGKNWHANFIKENPDWEVDASQIEKYINVVNKTCTDLNNDETRKILKIVGKKVNPYQS